MTNSKRKSSSKSKYDLFPRNGEGCTEWGVPDWRDASSYGDVSKWSKSRWRWEFYRRREDLREYFDEKVEKAYQDQLNQSIIEGVDNFEFRLNGKTPNQTGFVVGVKRDEMHIFGYLAIPNPRIGEQPEELIAPLNDYEDMHFQAGSRLEGVGGRRIQFRCQMELVGGSLEDDTKVLSTTILDRLPLITDQHEAAFKFNLDEPLKPQLAMVHDLLRKHQKNKHGKLLKKPKHKDLWLGYLRILDARELNTSWQEIVDVLYADGTLGPRKAPEGGYEAPPPHAARDKWNSANALRFNF